MFKSAEATLLTSSQDYSQPLCLHKQKLLLGIEKVTYVVTTFMKFTLSVYQITNDMKHYRLSKYLR